MRNRLTWFLLGAFFLAGLVFLENWYLHVHPPGASAPGAVALNPSSVAPSASLEAAVRALMPGAGLFRDDWLRRDGDTWNLKIPRRRDARALGEYIRAGLEHSSSKPTMFLWRDFPQWRGFYLEADGDKLVAVQDKSPALAIVIDDWGYHTKVLQQMQNFPGRLTIAVFPGLQYTSLCAETAFAAGHEVIMHLPMEAERKMPMLAGTLLVGMPLGEVSSLIDQHAATIPHMLGLNNHEGSKATADTNLMRTVCEWIKGHGGYFLDSKTSAASVGEAEARRAGIPYAARRVFLDNVDEPKAIEMSLREAVAIAIKTGSCIAIGHPRENTMAVITRLVPEIENQDVDLVRVSELTQFELAPAHE